MVSATWRERRLRWIAVALILILALGAGLWAVSRARCFALVGEMICRVETDKQMVALTFDDGPTDQGVEIALAALRARGARATFFLIGREVGERPHLVRRIVAEGHEVANHSLDHKVMVGRSAGFYDREIGETHRRLIAAGAPPPTLFRPPYGKKLWGLPAAARRHGYKMVMIDVEEPLVDDPRAYAGRMVGEAKPGSILLMHLMYRSNRTAREALPLVIEGLQARGFRIVPVGELLAVGRRDGLPAAPVQR
ncbi:MAG TPA: polysaccharide deacetylase family protein [Allosphingosinicella sp.]|nr:polysaccharide deacetylase family protein [Allosphingosinicella sp.]